MSGFGDLVRRLEANREVYFDLMRVYLGLGLFVKGLLFSQDTAWLSQAVREAGAGEFMFNAIDVFGAHYVVMAHMGGGLLLAAGLMTRISTLFQLPILMGAVWLAASAEEGIFHHNEEFQFTALVLVLLILILFHGAGRLSVDHYLGSRAE